MQARPVFIPGRGRCFRLLPKPFGAKANGAFPAPFENPSFVLNGEAVLLGVERRINGLHGRKHDAEVQFYAFDILVSDGEDLRRLPLSMRKAGLARLLACARRLRAGRDRPGPDPACLPDGVSKHRDSTYRGGRSDR